MTSPQRDNPSDVPIELQYRPRQRDLDEKKGDETTTTRAGCLSLFLAICAGAIAGAKIQFYITLAAGIMATLSGVAAFWFFYLYPILFRRKTTEDEFEEAWESTQFQRQRILEKTKAQLENKPHGRWQHVTFESRGNAGPVVLEERLVEFKPDGTGRFIRMRGSHAELVDFEWQLNEKSMRVRLTGLIKSEWTEIGWGFLPNNATTALDALLAIWFESKNPLDSATADLWPFQGDYTQVRSG